MTNFYRRGIEGKDRNPIKSMNGTKRDTRVRFPKKLGQSSMTLFFFFLVSPTLLFYYVASFLLLSSQSVS